MGNFTGRRQQPQQSFQKTHPLKQMQFNGQAAQDLFVLTCLKEKRAGIFVELGSNDPQVINNTWLLETVYGWRGLMVEADRGWAAAYVSSRPHSTAILDDATRIDYTAEFAAAGFPATLDYLQIDLEPSNGSTIAALEHLNETVMDHYKFATVTFEHDSYTGDHHATRDRSRAIFEARGYVRVFGDVCNDSQPYEDWYVHPDLVDAAVWNPLKEWAAGRSLDWTVIVPRLQAMAH